MLRVPRKSPRNITGRARPINDRSIGYAHLPVSYVEAQEGDDGQRLDNFLLRTLGSVPRSLVSRIQRTGGVRVNARRAKPAYRLVAGDRVRLPPLQDAGRKEDAEASKAPSKSLRDFVTAAVGHPESHTR